MAGRWRILMGIGLAAVSTVGFALTFVFGETLTRDEAVSPAVLSFFRFAVAGSLLLAAVSADRSCRRNFAALGRRDWLKLLWLGPVGTFLMAWCLFVGCSMVPTANASMADALSPLMIFAVAAVCDRKCSPCGLAGVLCGLLGALLVVKVVTPRGLALSSYSSGDLFVLAAAATWGFYTVLGRPLVERYGSMVFTAVTMAAGAVAAAAFLPFGRVAWPSAASGWWLLIALSLVSTLMPFLAWNAAQRFLPVSALGVSAYFIPVTAMAIAAVWRHEPVTATQWAGSLLIVASAMIEYRRFGGRDAGMRNHEA